jgi:hypothetical protein
MEKARKLYFKIKKTIGLNNPCKLLEKLFDFLVTPILLYYEIFAHKGNLPSSARHATFDA